MREIIYKNIPEEKAVKLTVDGYVINPLKDNDSLSDAVICVLGENDNLIPELQKISKKYPDLGILILPKEPGNIQNLRTAIQFSPFINKFVRIAETSDNERLRQLIIREAELTITRRKFKEAKKISIQQSLNGHDQPNSLKTTFLDKFLDQAPVGAVLLNENNIVLDVNDYVRRLLVHNPNLLSRPFSEIFSGHEDQIEKLLISDNPFEDDIIISVKGKDNEVTYLQMYISHIESINVIYKMVMVLDVTSEVQAEERSQEYLSQLENHNKELEQFAYIVSHDLKNPITTINLSCEMAEEAKPEEQGQYLKIIHRSVNNLLQMIQGLEQIIDVRKNKELKAPKINFQDILDDIINEYQYEIKNSGIKITTDFKVESIHYVRSYIHSIFHNMISNAIKYRKEDVDLQIHITTVMDDDYTRVSFADNGIGIDLVRHKENLFQPFRRFTNQATGKGIGLNIVKSMIEKNNGKVEVESTPGVGTTFHCFLCPHG